LDSGRQLESATKGCKVVVGTRLKRAGMHWTGHSSNATMALRCPPQWTLSGLLGETIEAYGGLSNLISLFRNTPADDSSRIIGSAGRDGRQRERYAAPFMRPVSKLPLVN